jgi:hypothetical protein
MSATKATIQTSIRPQRPRRGRGCCCAAPHNSPLPRKSSATLSFEFYTYRHEDNFFTEAVASGLRRRLIINWQVSSAAVVTHMCLDKCIESSLKYLGQSVDERPRVGMSLARAATTTTTTAASPSSSLSTEEAGMPCS